MKLIVRITSNLFKSIILLAFLVTTCQVIGQQSTTKNTKFTQGFKNPTSENDKTFTQGFEKFEKERMYRKLKDGSFESMDQPRIFIQKTNNPSFIKIDFIERGMSVKGDCVKVPCPKRFKDGVTCWDCEYE